MDDIRYPNGLNVRPITVEEGIAESRLVIAEYERRYGCSSHDMAEAVASGKAYDTRDIATWLSHYRYLMRLEELSGLTTGIPTRTT